MRPRPRRPGNDRWMVSYADFVTLLFALFVVMYAVERADQKHQGDVSQSIDAAFRALGIFSAAERTPSPAKAAQANEKATMPMNIVMGEDVMAPAEVKQNLDHIQRELTQTLSNQVAAHTVSIRMGRDGLVISLREAGFFASGSATPKAGTAVTLAKIAEQLSRTPYDLRIEGHTDNVPIHTAEFESNWELSSARATRIARLLIAAHAMPAERISAAGYAEFHPVAPNDTDAGRAQNRRVDLVVFPRSHIDLSKSSAPSAPPSDPGAWKKITDGE
ncbi:MAG: OmpA family protein [Terracidiphilus sp.]|nr:OmpA family protein [Terracidiphilus sp.]